jgi:hypothetical protein
MPAANFALQFAEISGTAMVLFNDGADAYLLQG